MTILRHLPVPAIGQAADLTGEELTAAGPFAPVLLGLGGNPYRGQFLVVAVQVT
jgi:hypothetical protein